MPKTNLRGHHRLSQRQRQTEKSYGQEAFATDYENLPNELQTKTNATANAAATSEAATAAATPDSNANAAFAAAAAC